MQDDLNIKLKQHFYGKVVRKDLTKKIKEGANVPVYVLEYLLGQHCNSDDETVIEEGLENVKRILANNYVRPDEAQKVLSKLKERGTYTVIDKVTVKVDIKNDQYLAEFSNLGIKDIPVTSEYVSQYERLLCGGIWCMANFEYLYLEDDHKSVPIIIRKLKPIQMASFDLSDVINERQYFEKEEWIDVLLRSIGMEPTKLSYRVKWLHLARLMPLVENNLNLCELGPRSTGKSHVYKEISPNSILVSGGQTTVANLFYNMSTRQIGLVGMWDCVAFDEVAGIKFKDQDGVQIMKDYMASGSFSRGKEEKSAMASMVFVGNINESVDNLLKTSSLFDPFPDQMKTDTAFLDRMHCYIPGWEIPKYRPDYFTNEYGFITDYLSEMFRELRKTSYSDAMDKYFKLGNNLNQRDTIAVRKMVSALMKLVYPDGIYNKEDVREVLELALELRRRVKEQLKRLGGMEFFDVNFSYIDNDTFDEEFVSVPEQSSTSLIPKGMNKPGHVYTVAFGKNGNPGTFKIECEILQGNGKFQVSGISGKDAKEACDIAYRYLKANSASISQSIAITSKDYILQVQSLNGVAMTDHLSLPVLIAMCSSALKKPTVSSLVVLGDISIGGTISRVSNLADILQMSLDSGATKVLLPMASAVDIATVPPELMGKFQIIFYATIEDAVFKALGVE
ncbi:MAG: protease Lon-related BREX system protein BrxL [Erysipelotrichaceae bacterium]|nr:protease Lon-related BREX system protein BrxL [Erysipelotrichaceae bacterium]